MERNNNTQKLYSTLVHQGYDDLGTFEQFEGKLKDSGKREKLYSVLQNEGFSDLGDFKTFEAKLGYGIENAQSSQAGGFVEDLGERLLSGAANFAGGALNLMDKGAKKLDKWTGGVLESKGGLGEWGQEMKDYAAGMHAQSDRYQRKSFVELAKEGDYAGALGEIFLSATESLPTSVGIAATGGVGLVGVGAVTASDKYDEIKTQNPHMNESAAVGNAIVTGLSESLTEVFGAGTIGSMIRGALKTGGKKEAGNLIYNFITDRAKQMMDKHWFSAPIASEALEEMANATTEYAVDKLTGVQRDDNPIETILKAGVYGAAGGAQFTPATTAAHFYSQSKKKKITAAYKESSEIAKNLLENNFEQFNETVSRFKDNGKQLEDFVKNVISVKNLNPQQTEQLIRYTSDLLNYNNYVEYVQSRVDEETKRRMDEVDQMANKDMGTVVSVQSGLFDEPLFITGGRIGFDNEGLVDVNNSDKVLYYKDKEGKIQQIAPDKLEKLISQTPVEKMYAEIMETVPAQIISEEEAESEREKATFNPGDSVQLPDGRNGTVQQMDEDGNILVNIDGVTEAIPVDVINGSANILQENVSPNLSFESQSNVSEQQTFPMKGEDIDYDAIQDPQTYANALIAEFAEDAGTTVDEMITSQEADLEKAMKSSDVIKRKRAERKIKAELNRLNQVKEIISPTVNESIQENAPAMSQTEIVAPIDQAIESGVEESVVQPVVDTEISKPQTPIPRIPTNEAGEPIYHKADIQDTLDDLLDGNLSIEEVDQFVAERNKDVAKRLQSLKNKAPKIGTNKAQYIADKQEWQTQINELQQELDYWNEVDRELKDSREKPGVEAALAVLSNMQPLTGEEMAARMLASGSVKLLREEYERETGGGPRESRSMFGLFAGKDKGGVSIERAGEILMQEDLENGTNLFNQHDPNAGRNAIIEVLSSARTRGDLINYIKNNRAIKAEQERQAQYNEYAIWCEENYRLSPEDYEAYEEDMRKQAEAVMDEAVEYVNGEIADEIQSITEEQEEIDAILAQNKKSDEKVERNDERGTGGLHEGGDQLLQEEQPIQVGRTGKTEQRYTGTNNRVDNEDGTTQEGSSEELDENGYSFIISPDGTTSFGEIRSETGLTPAPIKLSDGFQTEDGKGYGLKHIEARHGDQIRNAGYISVVDFVQKVANGYEVIKRGNERGLNSTYLLEVQDKHNNTLFIELSNDNSYWNVNSAGIFKKRYSKNKDIVWTLPAVSSNTIADVTGVNRGQEYGETATSGNSPQTIPLSTDKDKTSSSENQANGAKSFVAPSPKANENPLDYADRIVEAKKLYDEERKVDINPTDAQKEAGNYKKGHIKINGFDVTIEQPVGSVRSGKDANGKEWSVTMNNTYGYIRGTEGVDGDHIDVFLGLDTGSNMVYVVDQVNTDGSFDEHKVMMGFPSLDEARSAYLSNYEEGWQGLGNITGVTLDEFKKWITSSIRKTKPFVEYKSVTTSDAKKGYTIEKRHHEKKNKDIYAVNFDKRYARDEFLKIKAEAKSHGGYYSSFGKKGYIFDEFENAERFAKSVSGMKQAEEGATFEAPLIEKGEDILEYASRVAEKKTSFDNKGYKVGDKVLYKGAPATIIDFENDGRAILDTGNAPVLYEIANWDDIKEAKINKPNDNQPKSTKNRLVTDDRYAELKKRMQEKLRGQMNMGVDPEILAIGTEMAVYHIEKGARKFTEYARNMIADLGDSIRPYLKSFYNGARDLPEMESAGLVWEMTSYDEVREFDVANFDRPSSLVISTVDKIAKEEGVINPAEPIDTIAKNPKKDSNRLKKSIPSARGTIENLFTNIEDNERRKHVSENDGNPEANAAVGTDSRKENSGSYGGRSRRSLHGRDVSDAKGGGRVHEQHGNEQPSVRNQRNFSFLDGGINVPQGDIAKLKGNIDAIRTLKEVEASGQPATEEQKVTLSRYVGWGGLSEALSEEKYSIHRNPYSNRNWNEKYLPYYEQLKELLTPEEFQSAVQSTTSSHYTPEAVIRSLWSITCRMGFKGGSISEPAMGVGHIIGLMPKSVSEHSSVIGFELDSLSGRIASKLYPDANIKVQGYETMFAPKSKDLVITNVPFGKNAPYDKALDKALRKKIGGAYNLHNYFITKGLLELKEGSLGIFVTSSATMDGADSRFREFVTNNGIDLVGAIRLPNDAFQKNAGTSVTADILIFRKRKAGEAQNGVGFTSTTQIGEGTYMEDAQIHTKPIMVNEYFAEHPDMMLGEMMTAHDAGSGGLYSGASQTLKARNGVDLSKALSETIEKLPENILLDTKQEVSIDSESAEFTDLKNGSIMTKDGKIYVAMNGELSPVKVNSTFVYNGKTCKIVDAVNDYIAIKEMLKRLIHDEQTLGIDPEPMRKKLNKQYDEFVDKYGTLNRNKALDEVFIEDFERNLPLSLESVRRVPSVTGKSMVWEVKKGDGILSKRVNYPVEEPTDADNIQDAINISLSYKGHIDIPYIASMLKMDEAASEEKMLQNGDVYRDPITGNLIDKETYLSGNVRSKLEEARSMLETNPEYQKNVDDLANVQPETIRFGDISYRIGTPWIPAEHIGKFAEDVLGIRDANVNFVPALNEFIVSKSARISDFAKSGLYKTDRVSTIDLFNYALNLRKPKIFDEHTEYGPFGKTTVRVPNEAETQAATEKIIEISDKFVEYIDSRKDIHRELERIYNDKYNNYRIKAYETPSFEHYPGSNNNIMLYDHQKRAIQRSLGASTLLAHQVGTGKTFTMITTAMEMRRLGIAKKPMIVVQNATLEDFVRDFYKLYPGANVLAPGKDERSAENRKRLFSLIATGDFDAIVIPQSFLQFIPDDEGRKKALIQKRIDEYEAVMLNIENPEIQRRIQRELDGMRESLEGSGKEKKRSVKDKAKTADRIKSKTERQLDRRTDDVLTFEQMGIDALFIDEAHNFKKIGFVSKMSNVKGIDTGSSQRANGLLLKAQWIQEKNGGRNVILATGTPITNTMAEVWTMMKFVSPEVLEDYSIRNFDDFAATFGVVEPSLEFTATGNFKIADRFKSYVNVPELVKAFRSHADVVLTQDVKEFAQKNNIPKLKDEKITNVVIDKNEDLEDVMQTLIKELEVYNNLSGKAKREKSALPLVVFTKAKQAAVDLRLLNPKFPDNPNSKTNQVVSNIVKLYKESAEKKGTQLVFCDSYQSPGEQPKIDLFGYDPDEPRFNLYEDIKQKLIEQGVPSKEIAIINNYDGERRKALFEKVRNGDVRILLGSTEKMGVGVNVQDRLYALHHIDAPVRPMDFEQRNGRILRQGNLYATWGKPVNVVTYGVQGTLDATAYDRLRIKQDFINQMMKGDVSGRIMEERDEDDPSGMSFSEMAATLSGDETARLLFVAQNNLKKLRNLKRSDINSKSGMGDVIQSAKNRVRVLEEKEKVYERSSSIVEKSFPDGVLSIDVNEKRFVEKFGPSLDPIISNYDESYSLNRGIAPLKLNLNNDKAEVIVHFNEGKMVYDLYIGKDHLVEARQFNGGKGLISSIEHQLKSTVKNLSEVQADIVAQKKKIVGLEKAMNTPWGREEELKAAEREVEKLSKQLEEKAKENEKNKHEQTNKSGGIRFRSASLDAVNTRFNSELQQQIAGILPKEHVYQLGKPSGFLQAAGIPNLPIELRSDKLAMKASDEYKSNHPFDLKDVTNLPQAVANPIAIFDSKTRNDAKVVLTELQSNGDNFVVAIQINRKIGNLEVNSVRSIYPKDYVKDIYSWINDGLLRWADKQKATDFISNSSTPANVDNKNSSLSSVTKILESFVNPTIEEGKIASAVDELAGSLNTPIHIIGVNEITDENQGLQSQKRSAKGWYNPTTGETYLVLQNAESIADAQATVLHEVVAHKGLRGLLGDKFSDMMDTVYKNLPEDVRRKVATDAIHYYKFDFRTATEEYLASIAEHGIKNPSTWQKIKSAIREFFRSLGIKMVMRDEDIAYMLWKSKNRLEKRDFLPTLLEKTAKDAEMHATLLYRNPLITSGILLNANLEERRSLMDVIKDISDGLKGNSPYIKKFYQRFREGYQDRMLPLRNFQREVERERGIQIKDFEDAYTYENTTQGKAQYDVDKFKETELRNLLNEVAKLSKVNGVFDKQKNRDVETYMMVKHGLERNAKKREEELKAIKSPSQETIDSIKEKDYSGLTSLTKELFEKEGMDEVALKNWMEDFEKNNDTTGLWRSVKAATHATLEKMYQTNQISREEINSLKDMYEYYVPLKEWDETTAGDLYDYFDRGDTDIITNPIKTANGRKSRAGNILANIAHDYESAVLIGYKNLTKLRFANLIRNSKTDKAVVSGQWYVKSGVDLEGNPVWEAVVAEGFTENMEENAKIINDFEESMRELHKNGDAKTQKEILQLGVPIKSWQERQHVVRVKEGGRDLVIYINGDPRVSQAINGLNNKHLDASGLRWLSKVRQFMMLNYTSRSVNFILRNFVRDFLYTNTMNWVKYGGKFEGKYFKTFFPAIRAIAKYSSGTTPKNLKEKQLFDAYEAFKKGGRAHRFCRNYGV